MVILSHIYLAKRAFLCKLNVDLYLGVKTGDGNEDMHGVDIPTSRFNRHFQIWTRRELRF